MILKYIYISVCMIYHTFLKFGNDGFRILRKSRRCCMVTQSFGKVCKHIHFITECSTTSGDVASFVCDECSGADNHDGHQSWLGECLCKCLYTLRFKHLFRERFIWRRGERSPKTTSHITFIK